MDRENLTARAKELLYTIAMVAKKKDQMTLSASSASAPGSFTSNGSYLSLLPAELRRMIYSAVDPFSSHVSANRGLFLACKQTYQEVQGQVIEQMTKKLEGVEAEWAKFSNSPLRISKPNTLLEMKTITVSLPHSFFRDNCRSGHWNIKPLILATPSVPIGPLSGLLQLYVSTLKFELYEDDPGNHDWRTLNTFMNNVLDFIIELEMLVKERSSSSISPGSDYATPLKAGSVNADTIVFQWGELGKATGQIIAGRIRSDQTWWAVELHGKAPGDAFKTQPYSWPSTLDIIDYHLIGVAWRKIHFVSMKGALK
ncbi:hypothetical protein BDV96DRAFT_644833 [Lophiotrema nucula]|uniref:F-box domain-containing protein n=1 Tax=Lophiotrema nucula TaxID=690887 RepID=A0A6A5ZD21_9PLEO|nr:hypothetical protein BDV96DRAFT_644833 [Lophiotrema nucula]